MHTIMNTLAVIGIVSIVIHIYAAAKYFALCKSECRNTWGYWKVPFRQVYCENLYSWARSVFECHVWLKIHPPKNMTLKDIVSLGVTSICVTSLFFTGCAIDPSGNVTLGKGSFAITIPAADVAAAKGITADVLTNVVNGTINQIEATGTVDAKNLASNSLYAITHSSQGYVGQIVPPAVVSASPGVTSIGNAASKALTGVVMSQQTINLINGEAAKLAE